MGNDSGFRWLLEIYASIKPHFSLSNTRNIEGLGNDFSFLRRKQFHLLIHLRFLTGGEFIQLV